MRVILIGAGPISFSGLFTGAFDGSGFFALTGYLPEPSVQFGQSVKFGFRRETG